MGNLTQEIRDACEKKIAMLQQEIERLREGMKTVIDALQEDDGGDRKLNSSVAMSESGAETIKMEVDAEPTTRERMLQAIDKMPSSGFGTAEMLKTINSDGNPKSVNRNRALRVFNDLIHSGHVEVIGKRIGSKGGTYRKYHNEAAITESSPVIMQRTFSPVDEKGKGE